MAFPLPSAPGYDVYPDFPVPSAPGMFDADGNQLDFADGEWFNPNVPNRPVAAFSSLGLGVTTLAAGVLNHFRNQIPAGQNNVFSTVGMRKPSSSTAGRKFTWADIDRFATPYSLESNAYWRIIHGIQEEIDETLRYDDPSELEVQNRWRVLERAVNRRARFRISRPGPHPELQQKIFALRYMRALARRNRSRYLRTRSH